MLFFRLCLSKTFCNYSSDFAAFRFKKYGCVRQRTTIIKEGLKNFLKGHFVDRNCENRVQHYMESVKSDNHCFVFVKVFERRLPLTSLTLAANKAISKPVLIVFAIFRGVTRDFRGCCQFCSVKRVFFLRSPQR